MPKTNSTMALHAYHVLRFTGCLLPHKSPFVTCHSFSRLVKATFPPRIIAVGSENPGFAVRACKKHAAADPCAHGIFRPLYFKTINSCAGFARPV
jgi:hypothetical protein